MISWRTFIDNGTEIGIKAQIFASDGSPVGGEFLVNNVTLSASTAPTITGIDGGGFVISWVDSYGRTGSDSSEFGIHAQVFAADGSPVDSEFLVNSVPNTGQIQPTIARLNGGGFVISWSDTSGTDGDTSGYGVKAQIFGPQFPAVAQNDAITTNELTVVTGNLFGDNGSGADSDPNGTALSISAVNGLAASVGSQITLASGALLTVNADGTFAYDPNGAFEYTPHQFSGAPNTTSTDSFTYTLADGGTATVTLTISGVDNDDILVGTAGDNYLAGGRGDDTLIGAGGSDQILGGSGADTFVLAGNRADYVIDVNYGRLKFTNTTDNTTTYVVDVERFEFADGLVELAELEPFVINGTPGPDNLYGTYAVDQINGAGGSDYIDGYGGTDMLVLGGNRADYLIEADYQRLKFTNASDNTITYVMDVERFQFADGLVELADLGPFILTGTPQSEGLYGSYAGLLPCASASCADYFALPSRSA